MTAKRFLIFIFVSASLLYPICSFSQGVDFKNASWKHILKKAQNEHKFIFLQLETNACEQCIAVANKAFADEQLAQTINKNFISVRMNAADEGKTLAEKYFVTTFPTALFLNEKGELLSRYNGSTTNISVYLFYANKALNNKDAISLREYAKEYDEGTRNLIFLKSYILKRKELNIPYDSLLEEYANELPKDSLRSFLVNDFIFQMAPLLDSKAFAIINTNSDILQRIYRANGNERTTSFQNEMIQKTRQKAISKNDPDLAKKVAQFAKDSWINDDVHGQKSYDKNLIEYFIGVKDVEKIIASSINYYEKYYMSKNVDSLKEAEEKAFQSILKTLPGDTIKTASGFVIQRRVRTNSTNFEYGNSLNEGAWTLYQFATKKADLEKGLSWAQRAIDYNQSPVYIDTYAHLLYRLGKRKEAIEWQQKVVDMVKGKIHGVNIYEPELEKMKKGIL